MYTVYMHTAPNGKRYIGITSNALKKRWDCGRGYSHNEYFSNAIKKYGWDNIKHETLFENLTKEQAEQKEIELIAEYKSNQRDYGYNITNGGECIGKHSEETKKKMSSSKKGEKSVWYGKHHTNETKEKIRKARLGHPRSEETRKKISETHKGNKNPKAKAVICIETNKYYFTITEASKDLNVPHGNISRVCSGKLKTAGGYHFKYVS